jgi:hypothetical protein
MREKGTKKIGGGDLAGFVNHRKWELNLHISDFFCIFAAGKRKTDKWGLQR